MPALGVVDGLQAGCVECTHTACYYCVGKNTAFSFESFLPFGMNPG